MYNKNITVYYNGEKDRFELDVPYMFSGVAQALPSRKWNKKSRRWFAPVIRKNAEHIAKNIGTMSSTKIMPEAADAIAKCLERAHNRQRIAFPSWYKHTMPPRSYQSTALDMAYSLPYFALFMCVGSGKTKVAIDTLAARAMTSGELNIDAAVVACPYSIRANWIDQFKQHCPIAFDICVLEPATKEGRNNYERVKSATDKLRVLVVGIESLSTTGNAHRYTKNFITETKASMIVDESSRIKNANAKRTQNITTLGRNCHHRLMLTGTPITQGIIDLYAQMEYLSSDIVGVGDYYSFRNTYAVMGGYNNKEIIGYKNVDELLESISPYVFQVTAEEALSELPEKTYMTRYVSMTKEQKEVYDDITNNKIIRSEESDINIQNALEKLMRLQQVTGGFTVDQHVDPITEKAVTTPVPLRSAKVDEVLDITEESAGSTIVWCRFRPEIAAVAAALRKKYGDDAVVEFHGGINADQRWANVRAFESRKARFFVGNQSTGGIGLTLIAATLVIYYSNTFSYEDRIQSEARNHRIGQKNPVTYIDLLCSRSIDEHVIDVVKEKGSMAAFVKEAIRNGRDVVKALGG